MRLRWASTGVFLLMAALAYAQGGGGGGGGGGQSQKDAEKLAKEAEKKAKEAEKKADRAEKKAERDQKKSSKSGGSNPPDGGDPQAPDDSSDNSAPQKDVPKEPPKIDWKGTVKEGLAAAEDKNLLIFIHAPGDTIDPFAYQSFDVVQTLVTGWACVHMSYSKDNDELAGYTLKAMPVVIAADRFGNEFKRIGGRPGSDDMRGFLKRAGEEIAAYAKKVKDDWDRARELLDSKETDKALSKLAPLAADSRVGYPELREAEEKVKSIAASRFADADAMLKDPAREREGTALLESMVRAFKGTAFSGQAKLRLAGFYLAKGEISKTMSWVKQIGTDKSDDSVREASARVLSSLVEGGLDKLREKLNQGMNVGLDETRRQVEKIQQEYDGTEVGRQAGDVLKDLKR